jgi:hypothetical protein
MATAVLSHFLLDYIVHNPDLDLLGNGSIKIGLSLWNYPLASYTLEALLLLAGLWLYMKSTKSTSSIGKYGIPTLSAILPILNAVVTWGPPPSSAQFDATQILVVESIVVAAAFWLDRKRN